MCDASRCMLYTDPFCFGYSRSESSRSIIGTKSFGFADQTQACLTTSSQGDNHIHGAQTVELTKDLPGTTAQSLGLKPVLQGAPHDQGDETDEDVGRQTHFFMMKERPQAQVALAAA